MKSYGITGLLLSQVVFGQITSDNGNCREKLNEYYRSYDKKIYLSETRSRIKPSDTARMSKDNGLVGQFDKNGELFSRNEGSPIIPEDNTCIKAVFPTWRMEYSYDRKGNLRKKQLIYKFLTYGVDQLFFPLQKNRKPFKAENLGDPLFSLKFDEVISILHTTGIHQNGVKNFIGKTAMVYKYVTPSGNYWEYYIKNNDQHLLVLVSDKTGEVITKSFDTDPDQPSKWAEYLSERKNIFQEDPAYKLKEENIQEIFRNYLGPENTARYQLMKFEGLNSAEYYQQYTGKTWLIKSFYNNNRIKPVLMLLDDDTGKILIDINSYPKNIDGEQQFIKDFNELIVRRQNKK